MADVSPTRRINGGPGPSSVHNQGYLAAWMDGALSVELALGGEPLSDRFSCSYIEDADEMPLGVFVDDANDLADLYVEPGREDLDGVA